MLSNYCYRPSHIQRPECVTEGGGAIAVISHVVIVTFIRVKSEKKTESQIKALIKIKPLDC